MKRVTVFLGLILFLLSTYSCPFSFARENIKEQFKNNSAIIYTINIRNFAAIDNDNNGIIDIQNNEKIGTFIGAKEKLKDLKNEGINTIYLLPITPSGKLKALGTAGSLYAMDSFNTIAPELDEKDNDLTVYEEAKEFINEAHSLGLNVIVDLPSCGSYDLTIKKPDWFIFNKNKESVVPADWTDVRLFKIYNKDKSINKTALDNFKSFVDMALNLGFDGIRADVAAIKPYAFWKELIDYARQKNKDFLFLAEASFEWSNPSTKWVNHYASVDELLHAGFNSYYGPWNDFKNIKTKSEFDNKINKNIKILKRNQNKSTISAFATHDQQAPILKGENYWKMVLWLNATLPSNAYFLDGFSVGDDYMYSYEGKKANYSSTDDEYYFVHSGMFDIFNYSSSVNPKKPKLKKHYLRAIAFKNYKKDLIKNGDFKLLKTQNEKVFAYSITKDADELIVVGSLDDKNKQIANVKSKLLKKECFTSLLNGKMMPKINNGNMNISLEPYEIQVFLFTQVNSQVK